MNSAPAKDNSQPLSGIRVLEMGQLIAGPFAGQILASFGAEVIKVEPPLRGDPLRTWRELDEGGTSYWWRSIARNKHSVTLDLGREDARAIARDMILKTDVLLENFRPGRMESWGLGPEQFRTVHPQLIYTRVSGYGQTGPYADKPGFASACEAVAGLRYVNGYPGEKPVRMNLSLGDTLAGMHAAIGVLLALISRHRDDATGQTIDVSIVESVFNVMEGVLPEYDGAGLVREPSGSTVTGIVPTNTYRCNDGRFIVIGGNGDSIFQRLMKVVGQDELAVDPRLASNPGRVRHEAEIDGVLSEWCANLSADQALEKLDAADVPAGPVNSIAEIMNDPHFLARGSFEQVCVGDSRRIIPAAHPRMAQECPTHWAGPELGAHTDEVLTRWLDVNPEQIVAWRENKLI